MTDQNNHASSLMAQLRQAQRDDDLPDELAEKHDLDEESENDAGEERDHDA